MKAMTAPADDPRFTPGRFATTHWSLVLAAGRPAQPAADQALAALCQAYWYPLYAYVRRRTADMHAAQDLTQEFFTRLLEKDFLAHADPERGRFRAFLLTALKNFLASEGDRARAVKRGGGRPILTLDFVAGESRYRLERADSQTAERLYERQWALALLDRVLGLLRAEYAAAGKEERFDRLKPFLGGQRDRSHADRRRPGRGRGRDPPPFCGPAIDPFSGICVTFPRPGCIGG
jgi:DNA-directed RNA polymerase specialized sigma24 family protein